MLTPNIPVGPRNPNGYTEDEVLRAIRGIDGTREISFRYELLDQNMVYKRDLDNVLGGKVSMHYISEIKRTADFEIRDGGDIDYLFDHIKPYARFKMPPRIIQDGILLDTLWENSFDSPNNGEVITPENSVNYGSAVSSTGETVRYSTAWSASGIASCLFGTDDGSPAEEDVDFGSGRITLNFRARSSWRFSAFMNIPERSNISIYPNGLAPNDENYMVLDDTWGNFSLGSVNIASIKDNLFGQPIRLEAVNDGLRCRYSLWWTDIYGDTPDFVVSEDSSGWDAVQVISIAGGGFGQLPAHIDDIRVGVPGSTEVLPRTQPIWQNNFNGDTDMVVDMDSLRFYGNIPDDIGGYLTFNNEWSASGEASLQLGEEGSGNGSIQTNTPPRSEWSMRMYANIPEGGKLYVAPSPEDSVPSPEEAPPWAGPVTRNGTTGGSGWNFTTTTAVPAGTSQGDFMMAVVTSNEKGSLTYDPSWDLVTVREIGQDVSVYVFTKTAGPAEPANYEWTFDIEHWHSAMITSWQNVTGLRQLGINIDADVDSIETPAQGAIAGDGMVVIGFDWQEANKTWDDSGELTPEIHQSRGMLVSSLQGLSTGPTPTYTMTTSFPDPSRMAAITAVLAHVPDPQNPEPFPGEIEFVGSAESTDGGGWTAVNNIPVPAGTSQGDYMITVVTANAEDDLTPAAGWDFLDSINMGSGTTKFLYGRFAGVSEPGSYAWTWDAEHWHRGVCMSWRNTLGPRSVQVAGDMGINSVWTPTAMANAGDALVITGFDWGENSKEFVDDDDLDEIINQTGTGGTLYAQSMSLPMGVTTSYEFTSDALAPTRMGVSATILEAYQDPGQGPGPFRGPNWIVLDDEGGEYTIAGTDVTNFREQIFGVPIRIEIETDGSDYTWRVYSTDPDGDAPDINWYGDSSGWGDMTAILFQGGGENVEPTLIDEVTIGRVVPVDRPSPDEVNYIEFPLGVFLMTSPTRESDTDDVVTRTIEAYDRTKLFIDDKLTERMVIEKGENYTDIIKSLLSHVPHIVEPSTWVCGRTREFQVGTSIKEVIDRIAESINYHTLRFDEEGRAVVQPYVSPGDRSPEFHYEDNEISIMHPDVEVEFDAFDIANVWIVSVSETDGAPLYVKLENHDPGNPFSIPRRGRRIVDFRQEEEATDQQGLMRKAKRIQFEANRLYENVSFNTLINPLHSANDCYTITYGALGVQEKYTEINWEFNLEAGATMSHTARRNVKLDAEEDPGFIEDHLQVNGALTAGNIKWGTITVPTAGNRNKPVMAQVTGLDLRGTGRPQVFVTPSTIVPQNVLGCTTQRETPNGFEVWVYRTTSADTVVCWLALRDI